LNRYGSEKLFDVILVPASIRRQMVREISRLVGKDNGKDGDD
jgi:hypothetical protein